MHIGIMGGSFDPPHSSHKAIIDACIKGKLVDEVWVLPSSYHRQKSNLATFEQRLKMSKLLFEKLFNHVKVKDYERLNPSGAMIHMVWILMEMFKKHRFSIIVGRDCADNIETWTEYQKLINLVPFIIFEREDYRGKPKTWYLDPPHRIIETDDCRFSSTFVRRLIALKCNTLAETIIGPKVMKYILKEKIPYIPQHIEQWMDDVIKEQKI